MIPRYTPQEFQELWSSGSRYRTWLEVELAACDAMEQEGLVPAGTARAAPGRTRLGMRGRFPRGLRRLAPPLTSATQGPRVMG